MISFMGTRRVSRGTIKARELRRSETVEEKLLWQALRSNALGVKFRRQWPVAGYVADFVCFEAKLIVELDGLHHAAQNAREYDAVRTETLEAGGFRVIRFWNTEVRDSLEAVVQTIQRHLK